MMAALKEAGVEDYSLPETKGKAVLAEEVTKDAKVDAAKDESIKSGKKRTFAEADPTHVDDQPNNKK